MQPKKKTASEAEHPIWVKGRKAQPAGLFAVFSIAGITVLFLTIMVMFALASPARDLSGQHFPKLFFFSTPLILLCSITIEKTKHAFRHDNSDALLKWQSYTLALSIAFCVMQFFAWKQLWETGITMTQVNADTAGVNSNGGAYLYILSGLHVAHLAGGLCFLFAAMFRTINNRDDMVKAVIYFSDKREGARISALALYWHFLGALWCVMFLFFLWFFV
jgi:cytochrome c oxidase subunit 3